MIKIKKINSTNVNFNVQGQGCFDDCEVTVWVGRYSYSNDDGCEARDARNAKGPSWGPTWW